MEQSAFLRWMFRVWISWIGNCGSMRCVVTAVERNARYLRPEDLIRGRGRLGRIGDHGRIFYFSGESFACRGGLQRSLTRIF